MGFPFRVPAPHLAIDGSAERFPVHRVYCVGRNYAEHAREMGGHPDREPPFFFEKPADAAFTVAEGYPGGDPGVVPYPPRTDDLQHEVELVVALAGGGGEVAAGSALDLVWGYAVGVDLTRRDVQAAAKELRRPWDMAKGFDASAPLSALVPAATSAHPASGTIALDIDGRPAQRGDLSSQIWSVAEVIAELSTWVVLQPGDLIMTGTPAGVGSLAHGSAVHAWVDGVGELEFVLG
jgi:fumarylpyruvate hydrolase